MGEFLSNVQKHNTEHNRPGPKIQLKIATGPMAYHFSLVQR